MDARYYMPPEWEAHEMTLMAWPDNRDTWPGEKLNRAEHVFADILEALTPHEEVSLLVANDQAQQAAAAMIRNRGIDWNRIRLIRMPVNDVWIRDYGPISLRPTATPAGTESAGTEAAIHGTGPAAPENKKTVFSNWEYNAWGQKYPPFEADNAVPPKLAQLLNRQLVEPGMVLEGGSIDVNGAGSLLTTESVLLNPNRNPGWKKEEITEKLKSFLGAGHVIWLKNGLKGDDTDGHVDDLARFVSERVIFVTVTGDKSDPNYDTLRENWNILREATDVHGRPFEIVELPLPQTRIKDTTVDGSQYVPASYSNFYIANRCVLVPVYDERYDDEVLRLFQSVFPDRYIKGIPCKELVWGQGAIHCVTQQVL